MDAKDIEILSNEKIPESIRVALAQKFVSAKDEEAARALENDRLNLEKQKFKWNTPLVIALTGLITLTATFVFDRITAQDVTKNTINLEQHQAELAAQKLSLEEQFKAQSSEREFQYEIVRAELGKEGRTTAQRAALLLFLARAGVLNALNASELQEMAEQQQREPEKEIIPELSSSIELPSVAELISEFEGFSPTKFVDSFGGATIIGIGHVLTADELASGRIYADGASIPFENGITEQQAIQILSSELEPYRSRIEKMVTVSLTPNQRDALVSFAYNVGFAALSRSTLLKRVNAGEFDKVPEEFRRWNKGTLDGTQSIIPGLVQRREAEIRLWLAD